VTDGRRWAESGLMWLTGRADGPPLAGPAAVADGLDALARRTGLPIDGPALAAERAAVVGLTRNGTTSCGDAARLVQALDGWLCVDLPRPSDLDLLPAWLEDDGPWEALVAERPSADLLERAALLGLPVTAPGECTGRPSSTRLGDGPPRTPEGLRVVDLTSMWAGPLCASLLSMAGAEVIKVEAPDRPDGARSGPKAFWDLLHPHDVQVTMALGSPELTELLRTADVVLQSARPRALLEPSGDAVWVAITGHGLDGGNRPAFGDDAAVAGGLVAWEDGEPRFAADALADPITGLTAAALTIEALAAGGPHVVDCGLAPCAAALAGPPCERTDLVAVPPRARVR
jgi:hypothetical protein